MDDLYKYFLIIVITTYSFNSFSENSKRKHIQEVSFTEMDLKGSVRNPDSSFLIQKKNIKFIPLFEVQKSFDKKIRSTSLYFE